MKKRKPAIKASVTQFVAIIALTISVFLIVDFGRRAAANYRIQREADRLSLEVAAAHRYQNRLLEQRTFAASDLYVEEVARRELKWAKPGETVVVVLPTPETQPTNTIPQSVAPQPVAITMPHQAWWQLFFGHSPRQNATP